MGYPVSYFDKDGRAVVGAARAGEVFARAKEEFGLGEDEVALVIRLLHAGGFAVSLVCDPYPGQVGKVRIDAFGETASEVEATLLEYGSRCDGASQAPECSYGECVIERNLEEQWGATYSWRGRLVLHPTVGTMPSSERARAALERER